MVRCFWVLCLLLMILFVGARAQSQEIEFKSADRQRHMLAGNILALSFVQAHILLHLAHRDGVDTAKELVVGAEDALLEHLKEFTSTHKGRLASMPKSLRGQIYKGLDDIIQLRREGGMAVVNELRLMLSVMESEMKK